MAETGETREISRRSDANQAERSTEAKREAKQLKRSLEATACGNPPQGVQAAQVSSPTSMRSKASLGLRGVASLEAAKGIIVLLLACGLLRFVHKDLADVVEQLTHVLHANPEGKLSNLFLELANHTTDRTLWVLAIGAVVYAAVRWVEAYGLWREREWAQWFALLSTALYVPPELYELLRHPSPLKWAILAINVIVLVFMLILRAKALS